jgi:hypothetical protein
MVLHTRGTRLSTDEEWLYCDLQEEDAARHGAAWKILQEVDGGYGWATRLCDVLDVLMQTIWAQ